VNAADIPAEEDIARLDLGALVSLRVMLTAMAGSAAARYLATYEEILADTLALAALLTGRARQPPPPDWMRQVEGLTDLDDPRVEARILQLLDKTDEEIYQIITQEFTFSG